MAKFWILSAFCLVALLQITSARDVAETLNNNIREQLKGYQHFLEEDDGSHKADLTKLIEITESALKSEDVTEKQTILKNAPTHFTPEFNKFITERLEEFQVNDDIRGAIEFYKSLLADENTPHKDDIDRTVATLEGLLKETDLKKKEDGFVGLESNFSPEFQQFLKTNALPNVNRDLQKTVDFFENLLVESGIKFETEIKQLKAEAEAALGDIPVDEKQAVLQKVSNPTNRELYEFLQTKFIELN